ncbi:MAG: flagellar biosynthesis protein FlhF [Planctomycetes bacterium]|nr:flagellar biosynthesis protein FlhF [Planctomycetota bacterium]
MEVKTYRARSLQDALQLVRADLGSHAAVLHTREIPGSLLQRLMGIRQVEVTASTSVHVPSRFAERPPSDAAPRPAAPAPPRSMAHGSVAHGFGRPDGEGATAPGEDLQCQLSQLQSMVEELCRQRERSASPELSESLFLLFTDLIDAEISEELAREFIDRVRQGSAKGDLEDPVLLKARVARMIEEEISVTGPIRAAAGEHRLVALVGPTGVGKTTTIAKLAGNYHLREHRRVGLITVDTYRIAAVEQLRTYADIIDLPMEVVSTPREMRQAVDRFADLDLILMDTAGRSPRDDVKIQELRTMLAEAKADEVHLVLSSVNSVDNLKKTAKQFADVGVTALILTKLDEATGLGSLVPLLRSCRLPLSYLTNGQNVPDDIEAADRRRLTRSILGMNDHR